jgi:hypothetical protein
MSAHSRDIHEQVGRVLLKSWDPLVVGDRPPSDPERTRYIDDVVALLATGASDRQLAEHLCAVETQMLGYQDSEPGFLRPTAKKLRLVYRRLTGGPPAV